MSRKRITHGAGFNPGAFTDDSPFQNNLLVAMPCLKADVFTKSVVYVCAHSPAGAMGIIINQKMPEVAFGDLLEQFSLSCTQTCAEPVVHFGGPVETGRGFVLHSMDFFREDTVRMNDHIGVTGTIDILRAIAEGRGPCKSLFALGYAGWGPGQLDAEMQANNWLTVPASEELVFGAGLASKWERAMLSMGINPLILSSDIGHA